MEGRRVLKNLKTMVNLIKEGKSQWEEIKEELRAEHSFEKNTQAFEEVLWENEESSSNPRISKQGRVFKGDNILLMGRLAVEEEKNKDYPWSNFNLIYMDPPFFSQADYYLSKNIKSSAKKGEKSEKAYGDKWPKGRYEYLEMMTLRLIAAKELLSEEGLIWIHLDWHVVHYVKILMDEIFGEKNFVNEIIWQYKSGGSSKKRFSRKHDNILVYSKTANYKFFPQKEKSYNRNLKPYAFKNVEEFQDEKGWYTMVNMKDVWFMDMVGRTSGERTGYATQKPEALLERIIKASTEEGNLCGDFFSGSGTLASTALKLNRRFLVCDKGDEAVRVTVDRLKGIEENN